MLFSIVLFGQPLLATTDNQLNAISNLGQLNGIALQCRYMVPMQQIKQSLVSHLPKQRELGKLFEDSTNQSFMDFINQDSSCPDPLAFMRRVSTAISQLEAAYMK